MKFTVHLHTILQIPSPSGPIRKLFLQNDSITTISDLIAHFNINLNPGDTLFVVNGRVCELSTEIQDGDEVHFIPAISGGNICRNNDEFRHEKLDKPSFTL